LSTKAAELEGLEGTLNLMKGTFSGIGRQVTLRSFDSILDKFVNDEDQIKGEEDHEGAELGTSQHLLDRAINVVPQSRRQVHAIDSSSIVLGQASDGVLFSIRVVVVGWDPATSRRTIERRFEVPGYVSNQNKDEVYGQLRSKLWGLEDGVRAPDPFKMVDRVRNLYEKYAQFELASGTKDSILLFDGSLTGDTIDTPANVLSRILTAATSNGSDVVSISKKTKLVTTSGTKILELLDPSFQPPIVIPITDLLKMKEHYRVLGDVFVGRLSDAPLSFRIDAKSDRKAKEVFGDLLASVQLESGYPVPLIQAHVNCYYNAYDAFAVRVYLARMNVPMKEELNIRGILFGMYGGT
jgi:NurA domain